MWIVAIVFAALHVLLVAVPVLTSGGSGEGQAFAVAVFDFPLVWLLHQFEWGRDILFGNLGAIGRGMYVTIFGIGGTILWAALGASSAYLIRRLVRRRANAA